MNKATHAVAKGADTYLRNRATHWIRPPGAQGELDFLLNCTRCGECADACPHQVIFPLSARLGAQVAGTPAMDLLNKGCHLCKDWPCIAACEPGALEQPQSPPAAPTLPRMAVARVNIQACLPYSGPECGACASSCPVPGAMLWEQEKPRIDPDQCTGCAMCREACILDTKAIEISSFDPC